LDSVRFDRKKGKRDEKGFPNASFFSERREAEAKNGNGEKNIWLKRWCAVADGSALRHPVLSCCQKRITVGFVQVCTMKAAYGSCSQ
jgi:hypothetical protein